MGVRDTWRITAKQESGFFNACDAWQFRVFFVPAFTGLRVGELTQLLIDTELKPKVVDDELKKAAYSRCLDRFRGSGAVSIRRCSRRFAQVASEIATAANRCAGMPP